MAVELDPAIDLGLKENQRMTPADARRQTATVNRLLAAFTGPPESRCEVQLLADEVGLGKTFVALATAFSLLNRVRARTGVRELGLGGCYRAAVVIVPSGNHALAKKWFKEVEAMRTRCSVDSRATEWFTAEICKNAYDLVEGLKRASESRHSPCVLICTANVFGTRVSDLSERLRFLAACLFRWWGNRLNRHERYGIIRRAEEVSGYADWATYARRVGTGEYEVNLWDFREHERYLKRPDRERMPQNAEERTYERVPFTYDEIAGALDAFYDSEGGERLLDDASTTTRDGYEEPVGILPYCKEAAARRGSGERYFQGFRRRLLDLYKELAAHLIHKHLPLVIVDEAHHWRHSHRQDCQSFKTRLAPLARRLLLLTATPFQLHRDELLEVLGVGDAMAPSVGEDRVRRLRGFREAIQAAAQASETAGIAFSREWGSLPEQFARVDPRFEEAVAVVPGVSDPRTEELRRLWQRSMEEPAIDAGVPQEPLPPPLRPFFKRAIELRDANRRLRDAMRTLIVRHRRPVEHRRLLVGREYPSGAGDRPDQHLLHLAPGAPTPPHAELAQYLLMKVVAVASRGKLRTALGADLTGCYTTLWCSQEGKRAASAAEEAGEQTTLQMLRRITGGEAELNAEDARHPKVQAVVGEALRRWDHGEKSLIFCFRRPTAAVLKRLLAEGIADRLEQSRRALHRARGIEVTSEAEEGKAMQDFRRSLTAREGSGVPLFLDRVLIGWLLDRGLPLPNFTDADRRSVASVYARASAGSEKQVGAVRLDRVLMHRAIEHVWGARLLADLSSWPPDRRDDVREEAQSLLTQLASEDWVRFRYGHVDLTRGGRDREDDSAPADAAARSSLAAGYELTEDADAAATATMERALSTEATGGRLSVLQTLVSGPNLFAPLGRDAERLDAAGQSRIRRMRELLLAMGRSGKGYRWAERANVLDAVVRAILREDILLRLPSSVFKDSEETWASSLLRGLHAKPGGGQHEPLAGRIEEFLQELAEMGAGERASHLKYAMNPKAEAVALVTGDSGADRDAVFTGFNTPLLPDVLVCTQVGQEGIDLHRHCRHVVHYDLGWNPATLEQRTGRADRLGSKALRERALATADTPNTSPTLPGLDIALPYLAGTYDERIYDRLRSRSQAFEILTGGDPTADHMSEDSWLDPDDVGSAGGIDYVPLPQEMLEQLRVDLSVPAEGCARLA